MQILTPTGWVTSYVDYHRPSGAVRIEVTTIGTVERIRTLYFEQPRDLRRVWNYVREVGPRQVARRIRSRSDEGLRNEKYLWVGAGRVLEVDQPSGLAPGDAVLFLATAHPLGVERVVVPSALVAPVTQDVLKSSVQAHAGPPALGDASKHVPAEARRPLIGWSEHSGTPVPAAAAADMLAEAQAWMGSLEGDSPTEGAVWAGTSPIREVAERTAEVTTQADPTLSATLFGYGHYAKISLIPNLDERMRVDRVHEVDPTQVGPGPHDFVVDSAPFVREDMDVAFLAGFHHTHASLAAEALRRGAHVVIEKPLATSHEQLDDLLTAMRSTSGSVHVGFHKRFQPFNDWAREDLGAAAGDPVSYYCLVYEVPLPEHHWYRWPNSGSRLLSNGCHWVDHFLFLNDFAEVRRTAVDRFPNGDISASIVLENEASFHMILTDHGGRRIGVQDQIELRLRDRTVRIRNATRYHSEDDRRILRRASENKTTAYQTMYARISEAIVEGTGGESVDAVDRSARTVLQLENQLNAHVRGSAQ